MRSWKKYSLLFIGIGTSYLGNWIYLVALNILVLNMTNSAAAVAGIFIVGPVARIMTNFWAGSLIDRMNKRKLMILTDLLRGLLIFCIPIMDSVWAVYLILFVVNVASSFFGPSSTFYISKYVSDPDKKKFNSVMSVLNTGSFCTGPAIAGLLIGLYGTTICMLINAISFLICAFCIFLLPDVKDENLQKERMTITLNVVLSDWLNVKEFIIKEKYFTKVFLLFEAALMIAFALDSQEATFIRRDLEQSEEIYGLIMSLAGIGSLIGASASVVLAKRISLQAYIALGMLLTSIGYLLFYSSTEVWAALFSFLILGFFMSFSNAGYDTFYQKNVPTELMGRFGSISSLFLSLIQISLTIFLGFMADWFSLQVVAVSFAAIGVLMAILLCVGVFNHQYSGYYTDGKKHE
ncbi:MFS transporter [Rummeliibacillus sp. SL167]|uniref:MFS transporter n=1 Tax=Rummeliibacillus sp. SL167 TaxID=2579792 RepID=UPI0011B6CC99|nr:MFS transporter [Rummeliibacillus sp. SL167]